MEAPKTFKVGQRWASETQPELGLGVIEKAGSGRVTVYFAAADERLTYASANAPLRRVSFSVGDKVRAVGGTEIEVLEVEEDDADQEHDQDGDDDTGDGGVSLPGVEAGQGFG